jgi:hypothetical protein
MVLRLAPTVSASSRSAGKRSPACQALSWIMPTRLASTSFSLLMLSPFAERILVQPI